MKLVRVRVYLSFIILAFIVFQGCSEADIKSPSLTSEIIENEFATGFRIEKIKEGVNRISFLDSQGNVHREFILKPDSVAFDNPLDEYVYNTPITRAACQSTTHTAFFKSLGQLDVVKGVSYGQLVKKGELKDRLDNGKTINLSTAEEIDFELLVGLEPEFLLVYPYGNGNFKKIEEAGIPTIPISEYLEKTPLGQAEWIKIFGLLTGKEKQADSIFNVISNRYQKLSKIVKDDLKTHKRPTVITGSYWKNNWKVPSANTLIARYLYDCGAEYLIKDSVSVGNLEMDFESFFVKAIDADYFGKIFYEEKEISKEALIEYDDRMKVIKSYQTGDLFYCPSLETDYFTRAAMEPDLVLMDLIYIFHPEIMKNHVPVYFRKIESEN